MDSAPLNPVGKPIPEVFREPPPGLVGKGGKSRDNPGNVPSFPLWAQCRDPGGAGGNLGMHPMGMGSAAAGAGCDPKGFPFVFPLENSFQGIPGSAHPGKTGMWRNEGLLQAREAAGIPRAGVYGNKQLGKIRDVQPGRVFPEFSKGFPSPFCAGNSSL